MRSGNGKTSVFKFFSFSLFLFFCFLVNNAHASIVLKVLAANPSAEQVQKVPVKVYLPKEVKPEDIIEKGNLRVGYDAQQGSYYVYGEYELNPGETVDEEIEFRDIWVIPAAEFESLRAEADNVNKLLKNSEFSGRIEFLYNTIITKLNEIEQRQKASRPNPEDHISEYRYNLKMLKSVKADLAVARGMLDKGRGFSTSAIWKLVLFILLFLGVLSLGFYLLWYKQAKLFTGDAAPKTDEPPPAGFSSKKEHKAKKEEKEVGGEDIENILRDEEGKG